MKKIKRLVVLWGPVLAWMVLIFYLSSYPRISVSETYIVNFLLFKTFHVIEYSILFFLLFRATRQTVKNKRRVLVYVFLISFLYAISDEVHQSFVPTREGKIRDVFIDTIGIVIMYMYIKRRDLLSRIV